MRWSEAGLKSALKLEDDDKAFTKMMEEFNKHTLPLASHKRSFTVGMNNTFSVIIVYNGCVLCTQSDLRLRSENEGEFCTIAITFRASSWFCISSYFFIFGPLQKISQVLYYNVCKTSRECLLYCPQYCIHRRQRDRSVH